MVPAKKVGTSANPNDQQKAKCVHLDLGLVNYLGLLLITMVTKDREFLGQLFSLLLIPKYYVPI